MDSLKRSDNNLQSEREQYNRQNMNILSVFITPKNTNKKMLNKFFRTEMSFYKFVREYSLRQGLATIYMYMKTVKSYDFVTFCNFFDR